MNTPTKLIPTMMLALAAMGSAWAQTKEEHKAHHPQAASAASAPVPVASAASRMSGMGDMHQKHQDEMKAIQRTKDPVKRQKLMDKHMKDMHERMGKSGGMGMMGQGMGASAPGSDMKPGMGMGSKMGAKPMQDAASK